MPNPEDESLKGMENEDNSESPGMPVRENSNESRAERREAFRRLVLKLADASPGFYPLGRQG